MDELGVFSHFLWIRREFTGPRGVESRLTVWFAVLAGLGPLVPIVGG